MDMKMDSTGKVSPSCVPLMNKIRDTFESCVYRCRSVWLWRAYISYVKSVTVDVVVSSILAISGGNTHQLAASPALLKPQQQEVYVEERRKVEGVFEKALEWVGLAIEAAELWRWGFGAASVFFGGLVGVGGSNYR